MISEAPHYDHPARTTMLALAAALLLFVTLGSAPLAFAQDTTPPTLQSLTVSPTSVDVTNSAVAITLTLHITDSTGFSSGAARLTPPGGSVLARFFFSAQRISGSEQDGVYEVTLDVPKGATAGTWQVGAQMFDSASNTTITTPSTLEVVNTGPVDTGAPVLTQVTVSPTVIDLGVEQTVNVQMQVADDLAGIVFISYDFVNSADGSTDPGYSGGSWPVPLQGPQTLNFPYTFPDYMPPGEYVLDYVQLTDALQKTAGYNPDNYPAGSTSTITVINANPDSDPPELLDFQLSQSSVDVSAMEQTVSFTLQFSDSRELDYAVVNFFSDAGVKLDSVPLYNPALFLESGDLSAGTLAGSLTIPRFSVPGDWNVGVSLLDNAYNGETYGFDGDSPLPGGSDTKFNVINTAGVDVTPPQMVDLTLTPNPVDVTSGSQSVTAQLAFTDDLTGLAKARLTVRLDSGSEYLTFPLAPLASGDITNGTTEITFEVPGYSAPHFADLTLILEDVAGNTDYVRDHEFPIGADTSLEVQNTGAVDSSPPVLQGLVFNPITVDVTSETVRLSFLADVLDDLSGFDRGWVTLHSPTGLSETQSIIFYDTDLTTGTTYFDSRVMPRFLEPGDWRVTIELRDRLGNEVSYGQGEDLPLPAGVPSTVTFINTGAVDLSDPVVSNITFTPTSVDVTNGSAELTVRFDFYDDVAEFSRADFQLYARYGPFHDLDFDLDETDLVSGTLSDGTFSKTVTISQFTPDDSWRFSLRTYSTANRSVSYGYSGDAFEPGVPTELVVTNDGVADVSAPELTSITLPASVNVASGAQTVPVSLEFTDDLSGVERIRFWLLPATTDFVFQELFAEDLTSGTLTDGRMDFEVEIPQDAETGTWELRLTVDDATYNTAFYGYSSSPMPAGFPTGLLVTSDLAPSPFLDYINAYDEADIPLDQRGPFHNPDGDTYNNLLEAAFDLDASLPSYPGGPDPNAGNAPAMSVAGGMLILEFKPSSIAQSSPSGSPLEIMGKKATALDDSSPSDVTPVPTTGDRYKVQMPISGDGGYLWLQVTDPNN